MPCYDFTPVTSPTFEPLKGNFGHYRLPWRDGRWVQDPRTYSPCRSDARLLAIPASWSRVADFNPNWGKFFRICSTSRFGAPLYFPLYHVCCPRRKSHADLTSSPPSSTLTVAVSGDTYNTRWGLRMLPQLRVHFTAHADGNHAAPVTPEEFSVSKESYGGCQSLVRFPVYHRIKPHDPPLVRVPGYSFEF